LAIFTVPISSYKGLALTIKVFPFLESFPHLFSRERRPMEMFFFMNLKNCLVSRRTLNGMQRERP
jgi:hypothetical protein